MRAPASLTRRLSNRLSLFEYVDAEIHTSTAVRTSPTNNTPIGQPERPAPAVRGGARPRGFVLALCPPRPHYLGAGHRATVGHRDTGIIAWKGIARPSHTKHSISE